MSTMFDEKCMFHTDYDGVVMMLLFIQGFSTIITISDYTIIANNNCVLFCYIAAIVRFTIISELPAV